MTRSWAERGREKEKLLGQLQTLLNFAVAGASTPWPLLEDELRALNLETLTALHYRIHRAIADSYEVGVTEGKRAG